MTDEADRLCSVLDVEAISRAIDPEAWDDARWIPTRYDTEQMHVRRRAANAAAARVYALLPSVATLVDQGKPCAVNDPEIEESASCRRCGAGAFDECRDPAAQLVTA